MTRSIEQYYAEGCGRCKLSLTPQCKAKVWIEGIDELRNILHEFELEESIKWGSPCYSLNGKNICILGAFKDNFTLSFLKGVLINDIHQVLSSPGENSNSFKLIRFKDIKEVSPMKEAIQYCIQQAIEIEKAGKKVSPVPLSKIEFPEELNHKFEEIPGLENAFNKLSPGRQKAYLIFINQAKNPQTRYNRIEKYIHHIFEGKGYQER